MNKASKPGDAKKLAQAADRLTEATTRLSLAAEARPESVPTQGQPAADSAAPQQESGAADATDRGVANSERVHLTG